MPSSVLQHHSRGGHKRPSQGQRQRAPLDAHHGGERSAGGSPLGGGRPQVAHRRHDSCRAGTHQRARRLPERRAVPVHQSHPPCGAGGRPIDCHDSTATKACMMASSWQRPWARLCWQTATAGRGGGGLRAVENGRHRTSPLVPLQHGRPSHCRMTGEQLSDPVAGGRIFLPSLRGSLFPQKFLTFRLDPTFGSWAAGAAQSQPHNATTLVLSLPGKVLHCRFWRRREQHSYACCPGRLHCGVITHQCTGCQRKVSAHATF